MSYIEDETLKIPDFMLVDDTVVYGRMNPGVIGVIHESSALSSEALTLAIAYKQCAIHSYEKVFQCLWEMALPLDMFAEQVSEAQANCSNRANTPTVSIALNVLKTADPPLKSDAFFSCMNNVYDDIANTKEYAERNERYAPYLQSGEAGSLAGGF